MEITIYNFDVNIMAVVVASIVYFILGALWYQPFLFGKAWARLMNKPEQFEPPEPSVYLLTFGLLFIGCFSLAMVIGALFIALPLQGFLLGGSMALGFIFTGAGVTGIYDGKSVPLFLINNGYHLLGMSVAGVIIVLMSAA